MCNEMKPWEPYLPEHVCLYYVDYNTAMSFHVVGIALTAA